MKVEITEAEISAIVSLADDISSMIGTGDDDSEWIKAVKLIDRFLNKNGIKRKFK